jgi:hypothetical protein
MWKNYLREQTPVIESNKDFKVEHLVGGNVALA